MRAAAGPLTLAGKLAIGAGVAPTERARDNLLAEGTAPQRVLVTGNTVIDALLEVSARPEERPDPVLTSLDPGRRLILVTAHRRESFGEPMREMFTALRDLTASHPDVEVVFPVHMNPNVVRPAREILGGQARVHLVEPMPYDRFVRVMKRAHLILTDSGGVQEESLAAGHTFQPDSELAQRTASLLGIESSLIAPELEALALLRRGIRFPNGGQGDADRQRLRSGGVQRRPGRRRLARSGPAAADRRLRREPRPGPGGPPRTAAAGLRRYGAQVAGQRVSGRGAGAPHPALDAAPAQLGLHRDDREIGDARGG